MTLTHGLAKGRQENTAPRSANVREHRECCLGPPSELCAWGNAAQLPRRYRLLFLQDRSGWKCMGAPDLGYRAHLTATPRKRRPPRWPVPEDWAGRLPALPSYMPGGNCPEYSPIHKETLTLIVCTLVMTNLHFSISHCADSVPGGPFILMVWM